MFQYNLSWITVKCQTNIFVFCSQFHIPLQHMVQEVATQPQHPLMEEEAMEAHHLLTVVIPQVEGITTLLHPHRQEAVVDTTILLQPQPQPHQPLGAHQ